MQRIFLTGLSGSGKSIVGRQVAALLGWTFIDTDDLLSERLGLPVGQILVDYGEQRFRQMEAEALVSMANQERLVIATGGGAVIAEDNRIFMHENGLVIYLQVSVEIAWQRVQEQMRSSGAAAVRPLLAGGDGQHRLQDLFLSRKQWYEQATVCISTNELSPDILAGQIIAFALAHGYLSSSSKPQELVTLQLASASSQAVIEWGGLYRLPELLRSLGLPQRVFIITDAEVSRLYREPIRNLLEGGGFVPYVFTVPAGESSKSFLYLQQIIDWLVEQKAEHQEPIIALGGGVVGDLAGFVAACYQRGVPLIQIPTTLLAQVDAAIGGKTAINHPGGKNLIGAYYQPQLILVDPGFLLTLPPRVYNEGWAEIVKYGIILDADLFELLETNTSAIHSRDAALLSTIIARCVRLKVDVVQCDERDSGLRNILNYGHTFGHALETSTDYGTLLHGEAVALGMEVAARIAIIKGLLATEDACRQHNLLQALDLPVHFQDVNSEAILTAMKRDKKVRAGHMRWVLPTRIGHAEVYDDIPVTLVQEAIAALCKTKI